MTWVLKALLCLLVNNRCIFVALSRAPGWGRAQAGGNEKYKCKKKIWQSRVDAKFDCSESRGLSSEEEKR